MNRVLHLLSPWRGTLTLTAIFLTLVLNEGCRQQTGPAMHELRVPSMTATFDQTGTLQQIVIPGLDGMRKVKAFTSLRDCDAEGDVTFTRTDSLLSFQQTWRSRSTGKSAHVTNRFSRGAGSVRWEVEIVGVGDPWSTPIETHLVYPDSLSAKFWTAWGDPRLGDIRTRPAAQQTSLGILPSDATGNWSDPLVAVPFVNDTIWYGAPPYSVENPRIGFIPFQGNLLGIPLVTISEERDDRGLSLVQSPADTLFDMHLRVRTSGEIVISRESHRISESTPVRFHMDLVSHEAGWRGGLRWMTRAYPGYFDPQIPLAHEIAGTGAYSSLEKPFDVQKMRTMAFGVNWKASFDFPYMGMFIPPVPDDTTHWTRYGGETTSIDAMRSYSANMKKLGFHVLSYFNVTEFGAEVTDPAPPRKATNDDSLWKSADDFLYARLADAILPLPAGVTQEMLPAYPRSREGGPFFTWGNGIIMDPGEPVYQQFLLAQAETHIAKIPDAEGICIDRMDWLRMYNDRRDDGLCWFDGKPARSLIVSWKSMLDQLGPVMHNAGKVIFVNNHDKRIDVLRQTDGFFDEFTYAGSPLNLTALMGIRRPVLGWTSEEKNLRPDPDAFFQRYLHLGVFPMAPFPANDHSLQPGAWVDRQYLDYGPLLAMLKGKTWVLEPHCVDARKEAKVNLFEVPGGWVVPVTFGPTRGNVTVTLRRVPGLKPGLKAFAIYPGGARVPVVLRPAGDSARMVVSTRRGCALVRIARGNGQ
jgi:hypothetical protein